MRTGRVVPTSDAGDYEADGPSHELAAMPKILENSHADTKCGANVQKKKWTSKLLINPKSFYLYSWDLFALCTIVVTLLVTPFEVAFVETVDKPVFWWLNVALDAVNFVDVVKTFFVPIRKNGVLVKTHSEIAARYCRSWFFLDLVAAVPCEAARLNELSMIKILRARRINATRFMTRRGTVVNYALLTLCKFTFFLLFSVHVIACVWGYVARVEKNRHKTLSWLDALEETKASSCANVRDPELECQRYDSVIDRYAPALYYSVYTLTGTGYGDIFPGNRLEYSVSLCCMVYSAVLWAFMIGDICAIVAEMDKHGIQFRQTMDDVNYMVRDRGLPVGLRRRVRRYFVRKHALIRAYYHQDLETMMSSQLRGEVAAARCGKWIDSVWYLKEGSVEFKRELSMLLEPLLFAPLEKIGAPYCLYVMMTGVALRRSKVIVPGAVWGLDFLIPANFRLTSTRNNSVVAITYVETLMLSQKALNAILVDFSEEHKRIRGAGRWQILRIALEQWAGCSSVKEKPRHAAQPDEKPTKDLQSLFAVVLAQRERLRKLEGKLL